MKAFILGVMAGFLNLAVLGAAGFGGPATAAPPAGDNRTPFADSGPATPRTAAPPAGEDTRPNQLDEPVPEPLVPKVSPGKVSSRALDQGPGKLHVLFAFDTNDKSVGGSLRADHHNVTQWFSALESSKIAGGRPMVKTGADATVSAIMQYCRNLKVGPNDGIFVLLGCHGERRGKAHVMRFAGQPLPRGEIVQVLKSKKPRLVVLITDSCYGGYQKAQAKARDIKTAPGPGPSYRLVLDDLFFRASGMVNLNSCAPTEFAWGGDHGGLMTAALVDVCSGTREDFGKTGGTYVTWRDVTRAMKTRVSEDFSKFKNKADPAMRGFDKLRDQKTQTLFAFEPLGNPISSQGGTSGQVGKEVYLYVNLPAEATLYFDNRRTYSTGPERLFVTPPLAPGKPYYYILTAERIRNGQLEKVQKRVIVRAGETSRVNFQFP